MDMSLVESGVGHTPRSGVPTGGEVAREAEEAEGAEGEVPRGTALPLRMGDGVLMD